MLTVCRFARTDNSTVATCDALYGLYCGGSYQGLINHLDYIQGMGFTAVSLPLCLDMTLAYRCRYGYHPSHIKSKATLRTAQLTTDIGR